MPCSDGGQSEYQSRIDAENRAKELEVMKEMLCSSCRVLEREGYDFDENPLLSKWWDNHKKEDEARVAKEIKERNERLLAQGIAMSLTIAELKNLNGERRDLLRKYGFI